MRSKIYMESDLDLGDSHFTVTRKHIQKGSEFFPHWHNYFEVEVILDGTAKHIYNKEAYEIKRGSAYLMSYYDFHALQALEDVELVNISFRDSILNDALMDILSVQRRGLLCLFDAEEMQAIETLIDKIEKEQKNGALFSDTISVNAVLEIVILILRSSPPQSSICPPGVVRAAVAYLHKNFRNPLSLEAVADQLNISANYLGLLLKKYTGVPFNGYLNTLRLKYACRLLENTDLHIKEIAFASGYSSVEYFMYVFKQRFSVTPKAYRKAAISKE